MTTATQSVLSRLSRVVPKEAPRWLVYGAPGTGKTTFGLEAPNPVFIAFERRDGQVLPSWPDDMMDTWAKVRDLLTALAVEPGPLVFDDRPIETLVIDTLDTLVEKMTYHCCLRDDGTDGPTLKNRKLIVEGKTNLDGYGFGSWAIVVLEELRQFTALVDRVREKHGVKVLILSHAMPRKQMDYEGADHGVIGPGLNKAHEAHVVAWVDLVGYAAKEEETIDEGVISHDRSVRAAPAKVKTNEKRWLHIASHGAFIAKNARAMTPRIPVSFAIFYQLWCANNPRLTDPLRAEAKRIIDKLGDPTWMLWLTTVGSNAHELRTKLVELRALGAAADAATHEQAEALRAEIRAAADGVSPERRETILAWVPTVGDSLKALRAGLENALKPDKPKDA